jgi:branched-chain amino acid aminotransferase
MALSKSEYIWMNGELVKWDEAKIHVLSHVVHYGSSVFEGLRVYKTEQGPAAFRLDDHTRRLFDSAKVYRMELPFTHEQINDAILNLVALNKLEACYVRPVVYRGYDSLGVNPMNCPVDVCIAVWPWGQYLGAEALENGVSVGVSSWTRFRPNTIPAMAKSGSNYANGQLIKMEAIKHGYVEGICLDSYGNVAEGSGENIFLVRDDIIYTPSLGSSILPGITRDSVIKLAGEMGYEVREATIPREMLYIANELFFSGSAAEITPISKVDQIEIGSGRRGPVTERIQTAFFDYIEGRTEDRFNWRTLIPVSKQEAVK